MTPSEIKELIWEIDNEPGILDYKLDNGLSIWLSFRHDLYYFFLLKNTRAAATVPDNVSVSVFKRLRNSFAIIGHTWHLYRKRPFRVRKQFDVLNYYTTAGSYLRGDCYRSRISGFLDDIDGVNTVHIIRSNNNTYDRKYCGTYYFFDFFLFKEHLKDKLLPGRKKKEIIPDLVSFLNHLKRIAGERLTEGEINVFSNTLQSFNKYARGLEKSIRKFLDIVKPRLVIIEDGNYGHWMTGTLIKAAKEKKLLTAEIQHGIFDVAFQYGDRLLADKAFSRYKTDYVFTFGPYFTEYIRSSSRNINFGNNYLETKKQELAMVHRKEGPVNLLFVSQQSLTNPIIPVLYEALKNARFSYKLIIRLHPAETTDTSGYKILEELADVSYSDTGDIYKLIAEADYIIGLYSTALFEAIYFDKTPLVYKNALSDEFLPAELGRRFNDAQELHDLISDHDNKESISWKDRFWTSGTVENFRCFLNELKPAKEV